MDLGPGATVVMLTALNLEYVAVRSRLIDLRRIDHPAGTIFEVGRLPANSGQIVLAVTGEGNTGAAVLTERAITMFQPAALLFVGVAGALKDGIDLGDIVVATKVYSYHSGKEEAGEFRPRPRAWEIPHHLDQTARHVALSDAWRTELPPGSKPAVHFKPIAAGEVLLNSRTTPLALQLQRTFGDAVAIEMESAGVSQAGHFNRSLPVATVRGISDRADGNKHTADSDGWQPTAAANAATFALALAAEICAATEQTGTNPAVVPVTAATIDPHDRLVVQSVVAQAGGTAYGVADGSMNVHVHGPGEVLTAHQTGVRWRALAEPAAVIGRDELVGSDAWGSAAVELYLVPAAELDRLEMRRLVVLPDELAALGRARGLFTAAEPLTVRSTDRAAFATSSTGRRNASSGLAVVRTGQRSAWRPLPSDSLGAVLDATDLIAGIAALLALVVAIEVPAAELVIPTVGISPTSMVAEGQVSSMPRTRASMGLRQNPLLLAAEDAVMYQELMAHIDDVAEELAARVLVRFRQQDGRE